MSKMRELPGWKEAREAMTELSVHQYDAVYLWATQCYALGVTETSDEAEALIQTLKQLVIDAQRGVVR